MERLARICTMNRINSASATRSNGLYWAIVHTDSYSFRNHCCHGPPRHQDTAFRLVDSLADAVETELPAFAGKRRAIEFLELYPAPGQSLSRCSKRGITCCREPQHSRLLEQRLVSGRRKKFFPLHQRSLRPSCINLVLAITHSDDA